MKKVASLPSTYTTDRGYYWYAGVRHAQIRQCQGSTVSGVSGVSGQWLSLHQSEYHHQFNGRMAITGVGPRSSTFWSGESHLLVREVLPFGPTIPRLYPPLHGISARRIRSRRDTRKGENGFPCFSQVIPA